MDSDLDTDLNVQTQGVAEIRTLRAQNAELQKKFNRALVHIMDFQGDFDQITNGGVKKKFQKIHNAIDDWILRIQNDYGRNSREFREIFHREEHHKVLQYLGLKDGTSNLTWDRKLKWLSQLDNYIVVVLSRLIWCHLYSEIFGSDYPMGLDDVVTKGYASMIDAIEGDRDGKYLEGLCHISNPCRPSRCKLK
jgi:hypothetical protein